MTRRINVDALENRDGTAVTGDVFVFDDAHVDGGEWEAPSGGGGAAFPVGSLFFAVVSTNPATLLGYGTWSAFAAGRVIIGDNGGTYPAGATGGAETVSHSHGAGTYQGNYEPDHSHGIGTLATVAESAHTHAVGTLANSAESSHTHAAGTLVPSAHSGTAVSAHSGTAVTDHSDHTHYINATTSDATISAHAQHRHELLKANLPAHSHDIVRTDLTHSHTVPVNTSDGSGTMADRATTSGSATISTGSWTPAANFPTTTEGNAGTCYTEYETQGAHTLGGKTEGLVDGPLTHTVTQPSNHTVTQPSAHTMSGATAAGSSHSHTMSGATAAGSSHSHAMSGAPAAGGGHGHVVSGTSASAAPSVVQPYIVCYIWQRTA